MIRFYGKIASSIYLTFCFSYHPMRNLNLFQVSHSFCLQVIEYSCFLFICFIRYPHYYIIYYSLILYLNFSFINWFNLIIYLSDCFRIICNYLHINYIKIINIIGKIFYWLLIYQFKNHYLCSMQNRFMKHYFQQWFPCDRIVLFYYVGLYFEFYCLMN